MLMASDSTGQPEFGLGPREKRKIMLGAVLLLILLLVGLWWGVQAIQDERVRDLGIWETRLDLSANDAALAIRSAVDQDSATAESISTNASIRLYLTQLDAGANVVRLQAFEGIVQSFLDSMLVQSGLDSVTLESVGGQQITFGENLDPDLRELAGVGQDFKLLPVHGEDGMLRALLFVAPIFGIQADPDFDAPLGRVLILKDVGDQYKTLLSRGQGDNRQSAYLIDQSGGLLAASGGTDGLPGAEELAALLGDAAGLTLIEETSRSLYVVAAPASLTPAWHVLAAIPALDVLEDVDARGDGLILILVISVLAGVGILLFVWRHGAALQATAAAREYSRLHRFLDTVARNQPAGLLALDNAGVIRLANPRAARALGVPADNLSGRKLQSLPETSFIKALQKLCIRAAGGSGLADIQMATRDGAGRIYQVAVVPMVLDDNTDESTAPGQLVVFEDVTALITARDKLAKNLQALVDTLVTLLEARDPHAAWHSSRVSALAGIIARRLGLSGVDVRAAEFAAALMNLGKLRVPRSMLTRSGPLTNEERETIRESLRASAEMVADLSFDEPVVQALREVQAAWDGNGTPGLKGEAISMGARIIRPLNAFVALVSPRAHRRAISRSEALSQIIEQAGRAYDPEVINALRDFLGEPEGEAFLEELRAEKPLPANVPVD